MKQFGATVGHTPNRMRRAGNAGGAMAVGDMSTSNELILQEQQITNEMESPNIVGADDEDDFFNQDDKDMTDINF